MSLVALLILLYLVLGEAMLPLVVFHLLLILFILIIWGPG